MLGLANRSRQKNKKHDSVGRPGRSGHSDLETSWAGKPLLGLRSVGLPFELAIKHASAGCSRHRSRQPWGLRSERFPCRCRKVALLRLSLRFNPFLCRGHDALQVSLEAEVKAAFGAVPFSRPRDCAPGIAQGCTPGCAPSHSFVTAIRLRSRYRSRLRSEPSLQKMAQDDTGPRLSNSVICCHPAFGQCFETAKSCNQICTLQPKRRAVARF